jgi:hypothetical protein
MGCLPCVKKRPAHVPVQRSIGGAAPVSAWVSKGPIVMSYIRATAMTPSRSLSTGIDNPPAMSRGGFAPAWRGRSPMVAIFEYAVLGMAAFGVSLLIGSVVAGALSS